MVEEERNPEPGREGREVVMRNRRAKSWRGGRGMSKGQGGVRETNEVMI